MSRPIAHLRDDFTDNSIAPTWGTAVSGSATVAETGGQAVLALPSNVAGTHTARFRANGTYDLTGDGFVWNIGTMVATGVAAVATFQLVLFAADGSAQQLYWQQLSNAIFAYKIVAGVQTQLFTAAWNASTYKYLRIRESGGTVFYDSSTNGTTWTNRASIVGLPFAVTDLLVQFAVSCGNVASPGSLKLDDINLVLPALTTNWRWAQCERPSVDYVKTITISATGGQGYLATSTDGVTWAYYTGPIGSASGGYGQLVLAASQAAAEAMAVNLPSGAYARWDLPSLVQCRFVRLYMRSISGSSFRVDEFYPRRLIQSDDVEAESMKTINFAAASVTADKISVINLAALSAFIGKLNIDTSGYLYQGTGTGDAPTTGLKIYNSGGIGKLSTYNSGVEQVTLDTDGRLKAGAGAVILDATGIRIDLPTAASAAASYQFTKVGVLKSSIAGYYSALYNSMRIQTEPDTTVDSLIDIFAQGGIGRGSQISLRADADNVSKLAQIDLDASVSNATITMAASGGIFFNHAIKALASINPTRSSGQALFGIDGTSQGSALTIANNGTATPFGNTRNFSGLLLMSETTVTGSAALFLVDGGGSITLVSATANFTSTAGTASKANVYLVSGVVTIENKLGSTAAFNVIAIRSRTS